MSHRIHPEDDERLRRGHDSRRERFEHELAMRERIAEHGGVPAGDPAVEELARGLDGRPRRGLWAIDGEGITSDPDVPFALVVSSLSERTLRGMRREITARLVEIQLGGEEGRRLGALSRAVRTELARREAGGEPRRAA